VFNVRLNPDSVTKLEELAGDETEGNVSQMIRKLLAEALSARESAPRTSR
jgi:hypothetical protein